MTYLMHEILNLLRTDQLASCGKNKAVYIRMKLILTNAHVNYDIVLRVDIGEYEPLGTVFSGKLERQMKIFIFVFPPFPLFCRIWQHS